MYILQEDTLPSKKISAQKRRHLERQQHRPTSGETTNTQETPSSTRLSFLLQEAEAFMQNRKVLTDEGEDKEDLRM